MTLLADGVTLCTDRVTLCREDVTLFRVRVTLAADRVTLAGYMPETERWLAHAAVFALPSRWEGFGHVIVEAMAAGVPVVAYECPYGPRDILRSEVNGILVREGDVAGLATALRRVLERPEFAESLRRTARADAEHYAQPRIAQSYLTLFKQAVAAS